MEVMSFRGRLETQCPNGCEPFETEVWTCIHAAKNPELKEQILAGQLNLIVCPHCCFTFYAEQSLVYLEPELELIAFIYPIPHEKEREHWEEKMKEDFLQFQSRLPENKRIPYAPAIFFGLQGLTDLLHREEEIQDEILVAEWFFRKLGLETYRVSASYSRNKKIPKILPRHIRTDRNLREEVLEGLQILLKENGNLPTYRRFFQELETSPVSEWETPPKQGRKPA